MSDIRTTIKANFETGDVPTQAQFAQWIDIMMVLGGSVNLMEDGSIISILGNNVRIFFDETNQQIKIRNAAEDVFVNVSTTAVTITSNGGSIAIQSDGSVQISGTLLGYFGASPVVQQTSPSATTQTAGALYTSNEQDMLNSLKAEVNTLRSILLAYGLTV